MVLFFFYTTEIDSTSLKKLTGSQQISRFDCTIMKPFDWMI